MKGIKYALFGLALACAETQKPSALEFKVERAVVINGEVVSNEVSNYSPKSASGKTNVELTNEGVIVLSYDTDGDGRNDYRLMTRATEILTTGPYRIELMHPNGEDCTVVEFKYENKERKTTAKNIKCKEL